MNAEPIVLVYAQRDEPDSLVAGMLANTHWADRALWIDNRGQQGGWQHEGELRRRQLKELERLCREQNWRGCWALQLDPDERLEDSAERAVRAACLDAERGLGRKVPLWDVTLSFPLKEMWTPTAYRIDNGWAAKKPRVRMFWYDMAGRQHFPNLAKPIHVGLMPRITAAGARIRLDCNLYHLKSIEPMNRVRRAAAYLDADPDFQHQRREGRDWTWLYDETGLELEEIPPGREFSPAYVAGSYQFTQPA